MGICYSFDFLNSDFESDLPAEIKLTLVYIHFKKDTNPVYLNFAIKYSKIEQDSEVLIS